MSTSAVPRSVPPALPIRPPPTPISATFVQMPPPTQQRSTSSQSVYSPPPPYPPLIHSSTYPIVPSRASYPPSSSSSHTHRSSHQHQLSTEDRESHPLHTLIPIPLPSHPPPSHPPPSPFLPSLRLARLLQREEESRASEAAIRLGLTEQFARACGRSIDEVDLSQLSLSEAQEAIVIQLRITREKKKRGLLGGLRARFRAKKKPIPSSTPSNHLSVQGGGDRGRRSPSPSPPLPSVDIDHMSYEELLALSEAIGDVKSRGLNEEDIARLPIAVFEKMGGEGEGEEKGEEEGEGGVLPLGGGAREGSGKGEVKEKRRGWFFNRGRKSKGEKEGAKEEQRSPSAEVLPVPPRPTSPPSPALDAAQWKDTCSICLELFKHGDLIKFLPCFHHMHAEELDNWLMVNASCPICKEKPILH